MIDRVREKSLDDFSDLYRNYFVLLCTIADHYLNDICLAEEVVSDVFLNYWEKYDEIIVTTSIKAYLIRSVQNRSLNYIEHLQVEKRLKDKMLADHSVAVDPGGIGYPLGTLYEKELTLLIQNEMAALPEQCRKIFLLSRDEELTYDEIASKLQITVNTVKTQMKIALSRLREGLKDYLPFILLSYFASVL